MTQEVQPLTWQKRTNIEEHRQFHDKINEIVSELSGTVERSEAAIVTAHQAVVDAEDAVVEATAAITRADRSIETAQTAVSRADTALAGVATYDGRLASAESAVAANRADIGHLEIETRDLYDRDAQSVKHDELQQKLTDGSVTKIMYGNNIGSVSVPVYISQGVPYPAGNTVNTDVNQTVTSVKTFTKRQVMPWAGVMSTGYFTPTGSWLKILEIQASAVNVYVTILVEGTSGHRSLWEVFVGGTEGSDDNVRCIYSNRIYNCGIGYTHSDDKTEFFFKSHHSQAWTITAFAHNRDGTGIVLTPVSQTTGQPVASYDTANTPKATELMTRESVAATDGSNNLIHTDADETAQGFKALMQGAFHGRLAASSFQGATPLFEVPETVTEGGIYATCEITSRYGIRLWMLHVTTGKVLQGKLYAAMGSFNNVRLVLLTGDDGNAYVAARQENTVAQDTQIRMSFCAMGTTDFAPILGPRQNVSGTWTDMEVVE